jgi:SecD/SecF fusion protein
MTRALQLRWLVTLLVIAGAAAVALTSTPRLGLDLRGGTQIVLETRDSPTVAANAESTDRALEVLRRRVDALGVAEPTLTRSGERRIIVELPGLQDPREAAEVIGRTAQLTFHPVLGFDEPATPGEPPDEPAEGSEDELVLPDEGGQPLRLGPPALSGEGVSDASAGTAELGGAWLVSVDFTGSGVQAWETLTGEAACQPVGDPRRRIAIVLDEEVISSPQVDPGVPCNVGIVGGSTQITGQFTPEEAQDLAILIKGGALPVPVEIIEQRTVGPTLGAEAIRASWQAAAIGMGATLLFLAAVYRLFGLFSVLGLAAYGLIAYAALTAIGATLTLPGLAGFVLSIGMAVDANVLVFERAREEYARNGRRLGRAVSDGFRYAFTAILDSNVTTLLAAVLLLFLASGPVRGFGVTLSIGVLASMVTALVIVRAFAETAALSSRLQASPDITGIADIGRARRWLTEHNPQIMAFARRWLAIAALAVVLAGAGIVVRGLDLGVEFTGGRLVEYAADAPIDVDEARSIVAGEGFPRAVVQESGDGGVAVRASGLDNDGEARIQDALTAANPGLEQRRDELIGPTLGNELRRNALIALGVALAAQMTYLAFRFRWTFGAAAVIAMAHDVLVLVGAFAWLGKPIDGVFLAALLTIIGYSVNDTVVVFDRVRERRRALPEEPFDVAANTAVLQTVPRTVNTGMSTLFILVALAVLGGDSLQDFAIALIIGIVVGTWSSSFVAAPLLVALEARAPTPTEPQRKRSVDPYADLASRPDSSGAVI